MLTISHKTATAINPALAKTEPDRDGLMLKLTGRMRNPHQHRTLYLKAHGSAAGLNWRAAGAPLPRSAVRAVTIARLAGETWRLNFSGAAGPVQWNLPGCWRRRDPSAAARSDPSCCSLFSA